MIAIDRAAALASMTAALLATVVAAEPLALDGDTIMLDGARVRLWGIDAPEMSSWPWGPRARGALDDLLTAGAPVCDEAGRDRYDRAIAICRIAGRDLGETLIGAGLATHHRLFTLDAGGALGKRAHAYDDAERAARAGRRGVWKEAGE